MDRTLYIYSLLAAGKPVSKQELADRFGVTERTIQRDFRDIRDLLENERPETGLDRTLMYHKENGTVTIEPPIVASFTSSEAYAIAKILFESRSLSKKELDVLLTKLEQCCYPMSDRRRMHDLILNERAMYVEPQHHQNLNHRIWELGTMVAQQQVVSVTYRRHSDGNTVVRLLKPVGILTDNFYFYLLAYFDEKDENATRKEIKQKFPIGYRLDRILSCVPTGRHFTAPYAKRFKEGEFRKRTQFMFLGDLTEVTFWCADQALEAVLDRLPTAQIVKRDKDGKGATVTAEVYGEQGVSMWLKSEGDLVKKIKFKKK
ncbi:MAG: helix-turn-helix transcriptional regulator [Succiniclasticum sp.]|jgi:predicted DNA-binding transcriptional regulator YafY